LAADHSFALVSIGEMAIGARKGLSLQRLGQRLGLSSAGVPPFG